MYFGPDSPQNVKLDGEKMITHQGHTGLSLSMPMELVEAHIVSGSKNPRLSKGTFACTPPPRVLPHPLSFPEGGGCHLVNTKSFVTAHCVVVWVTVL